MSTDYRKPGRGADTTERYLPPGHQSVERGAEAQPWLAGAEPQRQHAGTQGLSVAGLSTAESAAVESAEPRRLLAEDCRSHQPRHRLAFTRQPGGLYTRFNLKAVLGLCLL